MDRDRARVAEVEAQLRQAQMPLGRDAERKAAEGDLEAAKAALAQAAWRLEQKSVAAPVAALVQDTLLRRGRMGAGRPAGGRAAAAGQRQGALLRARKRRWSSLASARKCRCAATAARPPSTAKVSYISAQAEYTPPVLYSKESRAKLMFLVEARLRRLDTLRPGQPVDVTPR